tara:strand:- start:4878 stop:5012 length:135 start_codon:yes stop_codon:yes gene_type:complete
LKKGGQEEEPEAVFEAFLLAVRLQPMVVLLVAYAVVVVWLRVAY